MKVVYLNVFRTKKDKSNEKLGTLEIGKNTSSGNSSGRYFEWRGANGTTDGGVWQFQSHPAFYGYDHVMLLTSNITNRNVVTLYNADWGLSEPTDPIFKNGANGKLNYSPADGTSFLAEWICI